MSGLLDHAAGEVVRQLLVDLGLGTHANDNPQGSWPIYHDHLPDSPNEALCVYNTDGRLQGRTQVDGYMQEFYGIQIMIRALTPKAGTDKARKLAYALDHRILRNQVTVTDHSDSASYLVQAVTRVGNIISLGRETPTTERRTFTINGVASLYMLDALGAGTGTGT